MPRIQINIDTAALSGIEALISAGEDCTINISASDFRPPADKLPDRPDGFYERAADDVELGVYGNEPARTPNMLAAGFTEAELDIIRDIINNR